MNNTVAIVNPGRPVEHFDTSVARGHKQVVLIAGSNNISSTDGISCIDRKISNTILNIKTVNPECKVFVQSILPRFDIHRSKKIFHVNQQLKTTCDQHKAVLIPAPRLNREDFTSHGLHLNNSGKIKLARSISNYLDEDATETPATTPESSTFLSVRT